MLDAVAWQSCFAFLCPSGMSIQLPLLQNKERQKGPGRKKEGWLAGYDGSIEEEREKGPRHYRFQIRSLSLPPWQYLRCTILPYRQFPGSPLSLLKLLYLFILFFFRILLRYILCKTPAKYSTPTTCISSRYIQCLLCKIFVTLFCNILPHNFKGHRYFKSFLF